MDRLYRLSPIYFKKRCSDKLPNFLLTTQEVLGMDKFPSFYRRAKYTTDLKRGKQPICLYDLIPIPGEIAYGHEKGLL